MSVSRSNGAGRGGGGGGEPGTAAAWPPSVAQLPSRRCPRITPTLRRKVGWATRQVRFTFSNPKPGMGEVAGDGDSGG